MWCEAKRKSRFAWYRNYERWQTGIDLNHWKHYQAVAKATGFGVYLFFLHDCSTPSAGDLGHGSEPTCPTGLFGGSLDYLANNISQTIGRSGPCGGHGRHGMVYWAHDSLTLHGELEEVLRIAKSTDAGQLGERNG